jgi:hypothetical protein
MTFSLIPDCLAARMPGTLEQVEQAAAGVQRARQQGASLEQQAEALRPPSESPDAVEPRSAVAWMKRRHRAVVVALVGVIAVMPEVFEACEPTLAAVSERVDDGNGVLLALRRMAGERLGEIPTSVSVGPKGRGGGGPNSRRRLGTLTELGTSGRRADGSSLPTAPWTAQSPRSWYHADRR